MAASNHPGQNRLVPAPTADWLSVATMLADLAFEADTRGRFTAFGPGKVFGQAPAPWLGTDLAALIAAPDASLRALELRAIIAAICDQNLAWQGNLRLAIPGEAASRLFRLSLAPKSSHGNAAGIYGLLFDLEAVDLPQPASLVAADPRLDAETGLYNVTTFTLELGRRFDRLDVEEQPGCLLYLGFFQTAPQLRGTVAIRLANRLKETVRPTDLLGRINETTLALWCDGMDHLAGGERAARFCTQLSGLLPTQARLAVGVAPRWARSGEDTDMVIGHAATALRTAAQAKPAIDGPPATWHVWQSAS
jgi:GGDEF domain-containing protein